MKAVGAALNGNAGFALVDVGRERARLAATAALVYGNLCAPRDALLFRSSRWLEHLNVDIREITQLHCNDVLGREADRSLSPDRIRISEANSRRTGPQMEQ